MKRSLWIIAAVLMLHVACTRLPRVFHGPVYLDYTASWFSDFMEIDEMAYSRCQLLVRNETGKRTYARISAIANIFDRFNLYAQKYLTGYTQDMRSEIFLLEPGENELCVYFGAPFGGNYQRFNKSLPDWIRIWEVPEDDPGIPFITPEMDFGGELLLDAEDIAAGKREISYDFDRDGEAEQLLLQDESYVQENGFLREKLCLSLHDNGLETDALEYDLWDSNEIDSIYLHDFGFADGSLELIVCMNYKVVFRFNDEDSWVENVVPETALIRVVDGQLIADAGSIYGSGSYHIEPVAVLRGRPFSIIGNRVTLENDIRPIRIDLSETLD